MTRNRIKRRLRAATGICAAQGVFEAETDYAVIARLEAKTAPFDQLTEHLARTAERAVRPKPKSGGGRKAPAPDRPKQAND